MIPGITTDKIKLSWPLIKLIVKESIKGKGIGRIIMNYALESLELDGQIIDLGSGSTKASYYRFIKFNQPFKIIQTDLYQEKENFIKLDLERKFILADDSFDSILCFNTLEHVYNYQNVVLESFRILKIGGRFIGATPFICDYHPSPNDYFRYSVEAINQIFIGAGYKPEKMIYLGFGPFTAGFSQWGNLLPNQFILNIIKLILLFFHIFLDMLLESVTKRFKNNYPLGYLYIFVK